MTLAPNRGGHGAMRLNRWRAAACAALFVLVGGWAGAQDVSLTARDGSLTLSGTLLGFDGAFFRIQTRFGLLTVDAEGVICEGPACPDLLAPKAIIRIVGERRAGEALLAPLLAGFAAARGLELDAGPTTFLRDPGTGQIVAEIGFEAMDGAQARAAVSEGRADLLLGAAEEPGLAAREVALDTLVPITAPDNPVPFVDTTQLARALSGEITNWAQIGGPDMPLVLHGLDAESDLARALSARLGRAMAPQVTHPDLDSLARAVGRDPYALAVTGRSAAPPARVLGLRDSCGFPLVADAMAVKSGDYPLTLPIFFQIPRRHVGLVMREFLDFLSTPAAEAATAAAGYVDRALSSQPLSGNGLRLMAAINAAGRETTLEDLQRLTALMDGRARLSMTFRFEGGSSRLNAHSQSALEDLARMLEAGMFAGQDLVLAGFSDGSGAAPANLELSAARAEAVLVALRKAAPSVAEADLPTPLALGEILPIACDETGAGRGLNRRVELWTSPSLQAR